MARTTGFGWGAAEGEAHSIDFRVHLRTLPCFTAETVKTPTSPVPPSENNLSIRSELRRLASQGSLKSVQLDESAGLPGGAASEHSPLLHPVGDVSPTSTSVAMNEYLNKPSLPLPLIIAHQLSLYFATCKRRGLLESVGPAGYNAMQASVSQLVDQFTIVERLASVAIPTTYLIHLKQCTSVFLATLP